MKYVSQSALALNLIANLSGEYSTNKTVLRIQLERNRDLLGACGQVESELYSSILLKMLEEFPTSFGFADYAYGNYKLNRLSVAAEYYEKAIASVPDSFGSEGWEYKLAASYYGVKTYRKAFDFAKLVRGENETLAFKF
jgi:hypothetical protein